MSFSLWLVIVRLYSTDQGEAWHVLQNFVVLSDTKCPLWKRQILPLGLIWVALGIVRTERRSDALKCASAVPSMSLLLQANRWLHLLVARVIIFTLYLVICSVVQEKQGWDCLTYALQWTRMGRNQADLSLESLAMEFSKRSSEAKNWSYVGNSRERGWIQLGSNIR